MLRPLVHGFSPPVTWVTCAQSIERLQLIISKSLELPPDASCLRCLRGQMVADGGRWMLLSEVLLAEGLVLLGMTSHVF